MTDEVAGILREMATELRADHRNAQLQGALVRGLERLAEALEKPARGGAPPGSDPGEPAPPAEPEPDPRHARLGELLEQVKEATAWLKAHGAELERRRLERAAKREDTKHLGMILAHRAKGPAVRFDSRRR